MKFPSPHRASLRRRCVPAAALAQGSSPTVTRGSHRHHRRHPRRQGSARTSRLRVNRGFHVNSNKPNDELLLPTVVHLNPPRGNHDHEHPVSRRASNWRCPSWAMTSSAFTRETSRSPPRCAFRSRPRSAPSASTAKCEYQACDNRQCFPPKTTPLEFDVKVVKPAVKKKSTYTPASPHIR